MKILIFCFKWFQIQSLQLLIFCMDDWEFKANLDYVFCFFFYNIIKFNHFIILLHLISSLSLTKYLFVAYAYRISIELIDCILLSSLELKGVLLISLVKTLCRSLLNFCCIFNIDLLIINFFSYIYINVIYF